MRLGRSVVTTVVLFGLSCGGNLNQTSVTCPEGRTFLDGVCVSEPVADYVACVRAQGAQLGAEKSQSLSAEAGYLGVRAGGAAELSESLEKKYSASDQAMLAIIQACNATVHGDSRGGSGSDHLLAHWPFDEASGTGTADASNHGNIGVVTPWAAEATSSWVAGRVGGALKLDGKVEVIVEDNPSQHSSQALTIAGWFLLTEGGLTEHPWRTILIKTNPKAGNWWGCAPLDPPDPNFCDENEYGVEVNSAERYLGIYAVTEDRYRNGGRSYCSTAPGTVQFGKWHHFVAVISSRTRSIRLFLDGAPAATCPISEAGLRRTSQALHIGTHWVGMLDDLRLYSTELSDAEIAKLAEHP